ncbi:SGNH/GDSL hydrolase family protein [Candidatus Saccharibacteria bacterium]|nr:SGNH/GDSL hydrolase family protein [Candidatus Saccharibacteria bacterium]
MKKRGILIGIALLGIVGLAFAATSIGSGKNTVITSSVPTKSYIALGDSVAAGVGLKTDSDSSACNRTNQSYPVVTAKSLNYSVKNLACSGATLNEGILGKQDVNQLLVTPQIDQLFALAQPNVISVTIGANDAQWTNIIAKCYTSTCGSDADTVAVNDKLATVTVNIQKFLTSVKDHYKNNPPTVLLTGYYQVFPVASATCTDLKGIDQSELTWGRQQQAAIGTTIESAAKDFSFAKYVPLDFTGHELCSSDSWVQGISDKQPYHPTEAGQAAIARQVAQVITGTANK